VIEINIFGSSILSDVVEDRVTDIICEERLAVLCSPYIVEPDFYKWHVEVRLKPFLFY